MEKNDGGSAFPNNSGDLRTMSLGMPLRDFFASFALLGIVSGNRCHTLNGNPVSTPEEISNYSYTYADAMLKSREK